MRVHLTGLLALGIMLTAAGCGSGDSADSLADGESQRPDGQLVDDAVFRFALSSDPGALDFAINQQSSALQVMPFAYDGLVASLNGTEIVPALATDWRETPEELTFTIRDDVACSDGAPVTPSVIAENFAHYQSPEVQFPVFGDVTDWEVDGDDDAGTVTFRFGRPVGFALQSLADIPIVCGAGLEDRSLLQDGTSGSGPYILVEALPNDRYVFERREGYEWGPDGATADEPGMPAKVELRVVQDEQTVVNLLLSGELDGARLTASTAERLAADTRALHTESTISQIIYNHADGHPTSDPAVRQALTMALDRAALAAVAQGNPASNLVTPATNPCPAPENGDALPEHDTEAAGELLDGAGWVEGPDGTRVKGGEPLEMTALVPSSGPSSWRSAAELAIQAWRQLGIDVEARTLPDTALLELLFGGGWDVSPMFQLNVPNPAQLTGFLSGPVPPDGQNLLHIDNQEYVDRSAEALSAGGDDVCQKWNAAEQALYEQADIIPVAYGITTWAMADNAEYGVTTYGVTPTSIRMYQG